MAKFFFDIMQGTTEWHKIRRAKVGGSSASGLFIDSETLLNKLIDESTEDYNEFEEGYTSDDMQHGVEFEPEARKMLSEKLGLDFLECGWIQSEDNEILGISPDGISKDYTQACEIKCPNNKRHIVNIRLGVQRDNIHQIIHNFTVNPHLKTLYWCSYRPTNKYKPMQIYSFTLDSVIDLGTKTKPQQKTISEWVEIAKNEAEVLKSKLKQELINLI